MRKIAFFIIYISSFLFGNDVFDELEGIQKADIYFEEGKAYYKNKEFSNAFESFSKASKLGNIKATYNLGVLYTNKKISAYNPQKAFEIFSSLAESNHAASQNRMGMYYLLGVLVDKDYKLAVDYFEKASKQGYETSQCNLALMYASGKGVFTNFGRAHAFAKDGYEKGNPICKKVWKDFNLEKYPEDKGFKFKFYNKP